MGGAVGAVAAAESERSGGRDAPADGAHGRQRALAAIVDAMVVAFSPVLVWLALDLPLVVLQSILRPVGLWPVELGDSLLVLWVRALVLGVTSGLGFLYVAVVIAMFGVAYAWRYRRGMIPRSIGAWYAGISPSRGAGTGKEEIDAAHGIATTPDAFRRATSADVAGILDAPRGRRIAARLIDVVMLIGAPPWWLLIPGPALLIAEIILAVAPVFAIGLIPKTLAIVGTRTHGRPVASVGQVLTGLRPADRDGAPTLVLVSDLPADMRTPRERIVACAIAFALGLAVAVIAVGGTVWLIAVLVRQSQIVQ